MQPILVSYKAAFGSNLQKNTGPVRVMTHTGLVRPPLDHFFSVVLRGQQIKGECTLFKNFVYDHGWTWWMWFRRRVKAHYFSRTPCIIQPDICFVTSHTEQFSFCIFMAYLSLLPDHKVGKANDEKIRRPQRPFQHPNLGTFYIEHTVRYKV